MVTLENLGEFNIINLLQAYIDPSEFLGKNEDAYLYNRDRPYIFVNVDTMLRNSDFLPNQTWSQLGAKLVAITFSDLVAKGASPNTFISSLILEGLMKESELRELVSGIQKTSHKYGAKYLGGDLGSSTEAVLTGVGLGSIKKGNILTRSNAKYRDLVCVTGNFGLTSVGLDYLISPHSRKFDTVPDHLLALGVSLLYEPQPRLTEGILLSEHNIATSSIDSSDGLSVSLHWLSQASRTGIIVHDLPIHPELESYLDSYNTILEATMFGGEEYELVFTIPPSRLHELEDLFLEKKSNFSVIGECTESQGIFVSHEGDLISLPMKGWDAFQKETTR